MQLSRETCRKPLQKTLMRMEKRGCPADNGRSSTFPQRSHPPSPRLRCTSAHVPALLQTETLWNLWSHAAAITEQLLALFSLDSRSPLRVLTCFRSFRPSSALGPPNPTPPSSNQRKQNSVISPESPGGLTASPSGPAGLRPLLIVFKRGG